MNVNFRLRFRSHWKRREQFGALATHVDTIFQPISPSIRSGMRWIQILYSWWSFSGEDQLKLEMSNSSSTSMKTITSMVMSPSLPTSDITLECSISRIVGNSDQSCECVKNFNSTSTVETSKAHGLRIIRHCMSCQASFVILPIYDRWKLFSGEHHRRKEQTQGRENNRWMSL